MATLIQSVSGSTSPAAATSLAVTINGVGNGNTIVAYAGCSLSGRTITVADNVNSGNYNQDNFHNGANSSIGIFTFPGVAGGNTKVTMTLSTSTLCSMILEEWSGFSLPTPFDKGATGTGTSATTGTSGSTGTLSQATELVLACCMLSSGSGGSFVVSNPFTANTSPAVQLAAGNYQPGVTTAVTATFTWLAPAANWQIIVATYRTGISQSPPIGAFTAVLP